MNTVLVTNAIQRKSLSVVRSLGRRGHLVNCCDSMAMNPTRWSKYSRRFFTNPSPYTSEDAFYKFLVQRIENGECDVLMPMDDDTMRVVVKNEHRLRCLCKLAVPAELAYRQAADKSSAVQAAKKQGAVCPETIRVNSLESLHEKTEHMTYPLVIKPRNSSGSRGIRIVHDPNTLPDIYSTIHHQYPYPVIQSYVPHTAKYDVGLIYNRQHQMRAAFVQREVRCYPIEYGPSTVQESVHYPELIALSKRIMSHFEWVGIVELEFLIDERTGRPVFMEINPRFWASLELAVKAGVDFPYLYHQLANEGDCDLVDTYKVGIQTRWSIPGDVLYFLHARDRFRMKPSIVPCKKAGVYDDTFSLDDPWPTIGVIATGLYGLFHREIRKMVLSR